MRRLSRPGLAAACAAALLLAGCGGGGDDAGPTTPDALATVPDSANASAAAYTAFATTLVDQGARADTTAPLRMNAAQAPTSESANPAGL